MFKRKFGFLKTKTVDWLSRSTQDDGMSSWVKVKSEISWFLLSSSATVASM